MTPKTALMASPVLYYVRVWRLWRMLLFYCSDLQTELSTITDDISRITSIQERLQKWSDLRDKAWAVRQKSLQALNEDIKNLPN